VLAVPDAILRSIASLTLRLKSPGRRLVYY
jgi:hypothetical protein